MIDMDNETTLCEETSWGKRLFLEDSSSVQRYTMVTLLCVSMATIILFNSIIIVRMCCQSKHKLFTRFFITSLALTDLLVGITVLPYNVINFFVNADVFDHMTCDIITSYDVMLVALSTYILAILTFERYIAICKPFSYERFCGKTAMVTFTTTVVFIAVGLSFGLIFTGYSYAGINQKLKCLKQATNGPCTVVVSVSYGLTAAALILLVPGATIVWCNVKVVLFVKNACEIGKAVTSAGVTRTLYHVRHVRVARTIAILTGSFVVCWTPFLICFIYNVTSGYTLPGHVLYFVTWLAYTNSAVNPVLYLLLDGRVCCRRP